MGVQTVGLAGQDPLEIGPQDAYVAQGARNYGTFQTGLNGAAQDGGLAPTADFNVAGCKAFAQSTLDAGCAQPVEAWNATKWPVAAHNNHPCLTHLTVDQHVQLILVAQCIQRECTDTKLCRE